MSSSSIKTARKSVNQYILQTKAKLLDSVLKKKKVVRKCKTDMKSHGRITQLYNNINWNELFG